MEALQRHAPITPETFKLAMRRFASNVNVITSSHDGQLGGMTATAVCSATAEPPCLLIVVNRSNRSHRLISQSSAFSVNLLSEEQIDLASNFASSKDDNYIGVSITRGVNNCPHIDGADAVVDCEVINSVELSTHTVFIGQVVASAVNDRNPLLYHSSGYGRFELDGAPSAAPCKKRVTATLRSAAVA